MLRNDRQTKPGLVALYDIRPGNGAGPFLQPRSPYGATINMTTTAAFAATATAAEANTTEQLLLQLLLLQLLLTFQRTLIDFITFQVR